MPLGRPNVEWLDARGRIEGLLRATKYRKDPEVAEQARQALERRMPLLLDTLQSRNVRHIGPAPSWLCEIGTIPERLTRPTVGLIPASPFAEDGHTIDPSVSVPIPAAARFAEIPAPVPELEPQGLRSRA